MAITPQDISDKEFSKALRGYDEMEVDAYLDEIIEAMDVLIRENTTLKEHVEALDEQVGYFKSMETTIKETLLTAQKAAEGILENARNQRDEMITAAQRDNEQQNRQLQRDIENNRREKEEMERNVLDLRRQIREMYERELARLQDPE